CSSRRLHTRSERDWSSDVCSSDLDGDTPGESCLVLAEANGCLTYGNTIIPVNEVRYPSYLYNVNNKTQARLVVGTNFRPTSDNRSEERRVGKEGRYGTSEYHARRR